MASELDEKITDWLQRVKKLEHEVWATMMEMPVTDGRAHQLRRASLALEQTVDRLNEAAAE